MKLWEATNGFVGYSYVRCHVVAPNEERALELARVKFKEKDEREAYYKNVEVELLIDDLTVEQATEIVS